MKTLATLLAVAFLAAVSIPATAEEYPCYEKLHSIYKKTEAANNLAWEYNKKGKKVNMEKFCSLQKKVGRLQAEWQSMLTPACCPSNGVVQVACRKGALKTGVEMYQKYCTKH